LFIVFLSFVLFEKFQVISESCGLIVHPHKATADLKLGTGLNR
jgi:hypothetical protein